MENSSTISALTGPPESAIVEASDTINTPPSSLPSQPNEAALEAAEYLRSAGLTVDYQEALPDWMLDTPRRLIDPSADPTTGLTSWDGLPDCSVPAAVPAVEKWSVSDKTVMYIQDVCKRRSEDEVQGYVREIRAAAEKAGSVRGLKVELPALRTDHDLDFRAYERDICAALQVHLADHHLPLDPCDKERDECLGFPSTAYLAGERIVKSMEKEKIEISRESLMAFKSLLKSDWTEEDQQAVLTAKVNYKGLLSKDPLTPPISPKLQAQDAYIPDAETCQIPIPSDPSSRISEDLQKVEDQIFEDEDDGWMPTAELEAMIGADNIEGFAMSADTVQMIDDFKVDVPLMPAVVPDEPTRMSPDFANIPDMIGNITPFDPEALSMNMNEETLMEHMKEMGAKAMRTIEQEKLEPLDGTVRVKVPIMDFDRLDPDWHQLRGNASAIFKNIPQECRVCYTGLKWTKKLVEESKMNWKIWNAPVPRLSDEPPIEDTGLMEYFLQDTDDADLLTSANLVSKKPGLAILDQGDDSEDDLEPFFSAQKQKQKQPQGDWSTIIMKRKHLLDEQDTVQYQESNGGMTPDKGLVHNGTVSAPSSILVHGEEDAGARLLQNFLDLRAPKKQRLAHSPFFKRPELPAAKPSRPRTKHLASTIKADAEPPAIQPEKIMPCPSITPQAKPLRLIIAVTVHRSLITHLERLLPGLSLVDRDYNAHNSSIWIPGSVCRSEVPSAIADEADLIVSPSTGIVLTSMIKVRQKPLPGTRGTSLLRGRIENVGAKYERLVVLVSEDNKLDEGMHDMGASEAAALAGFRAFAATLPSETTVVYVGGGVETLARWAAAVASRYAAGGAGLAELLVQEETHWELFLRRAGMNVYAAQAVLGMLRAPEGTPVIDCRRAYGLPAFVKMEEEQRMGMFGTVLGGRRVLGRVGRVLDARWGAVLQRP